MTVTIFHNPACSKSRATLALIREAGIEPEVVLYLQTPPDRARLEGLLAAMGLTARELLRKGEAAYGELGLADPARSEAELVAAMIAHPRLIERPIVETPKGTRLCRPPERVREIL
ncbi:arsenate reductase (glutaredoxin) [Albimonas sp. CAU 1670]|uniref:arsenate reductase (glutaredoxin) n=1 Tax=Albimonas sp. CAU 1670 TaxID=3032599 RepID=UPI0023DBC0A5|nr:arsenate reductase (glutaredoxin) [Albimonas sp. CAU 1670]MDF2233824.1 arsenate reductase (glutaredoxin) [Albimonas sp. CAU 1670]